jgi:UrcA family protein
LLPRIEKRDYLDGRSGKIPGSRQEERPMKITLLIIAGSAFLTGLAIKAAPAFAQAPSPINTSVVRTMDLDLSSESGRRLLDRRLAIAAVTVCGVPSSVDLKGRNNVIECRKEALAQGRAKARDIVAGSDRATILIARSN